MSVTSYDSLRIRVGKYLFENKAKKAHIWILFKYGDPVGKVQYHVDDPLVQKFIRVRTLWEPRWQKKFVRSRYGNNQTNRLLQKE